MAKRRLSAVPAGPPQPGLAEDQAAPRAGDRGGGLAAGAGDPQGPGLADRGGERRGGLRHAGQVGSGINARMRRELLAAMEPIRRPDPPLVKKPRLPEARWVEPRIVIRAEFTDWTRDGLLRQAAFKGIELDRDPAKVVREEAIPAARVVQRRHRPTAGPASARRRSRPPAKAASRSRGEGAWPPAEMDPTPASRAELKALDEMEREGHWAVAGHEVRVTNLDKVLIPAEGDHAAVTKRDLLRYYVDHRPHHAAAPGRPRAEPAALPGRHRADGLLAEGRAGPRAEVGEPLELHGARGQEGLRGGRQGRHPRLAGAGGGAGAASLDVAHRCAARADLRADRRRSGRQHDLGGGADPRRACIGPRWSTWASSACPRPPASAASRYGCRCAAGIASTRRATGWSSCR